MKSVIALFITLLATASAFAPVQQTVTVAIRAAATTSLSMAAQSPEMKKGVFAAVGLAAPTVFSSLAAVATDGTSEWFGVDDTRLLAVLFVVHWGILTLWLQQYGDADEDEDFFGEIDYTGN